MPVDLLIAVAVVLLAVTATLLAADWRRRLSARRFDQVYERNLLRRTGRG
jgi:hypothetical protein